MSSNQITSNRFAAIFSLIRQSLNGELQDYTTGSIRKAVILLAIPMMLEMCMESVFAVVDIYFVSHLGKHATSTVGLTESVITIVYSLAIGISMAATAMVARRVGEKNPDAAANAAGSGVHRRHAGVANQCRAIRRLVVGRRRWRGRPGYRDSRHARGSARWRRSAIGAYKQHDASNAAAYDHAK